MASSSSTKNFSYHTRSISLPSRSHPLTLQVEEQLLHLRSSELATTSSSSICHNLACLRDLYKSVDDLIQLPLTQQFLSSGTQEKQVERVLDGSLKLLDVCGTSRETLAQMKHSVQDLQSSLRRRGVVSDVANEVCAYTSSRKKGYKVLQKCIVDMKKMDSKSAPLNKEDIITILSEVQTLTLAVFESLLSSVSNSKAESKQSNWHLVSKLKRTKSIVCNEECQDTSEFAKVDAVLKTLKGQKSSDVANLKKVQKPLEAVEMRIQ
ncbi:carrier protein, partial [Thalictrum thalictroides]